MLEDVCSNPAHTVYHRARGSVCSGALRHWRARRANVPAMSGDWVKKKKNKKKRTKSFMSDARYSTDLLLLGVRSLHDQGRSEDE